MLRVSILFVLSANHLVDSELAKRSRMSKISGAVYPDKIRSQGKRGKEGDDT